MNRIVLIGNGFDLAHGLKTRYEDFINWYWDYRVNGFVNERKSISTDILCSIEDRLNQSWSTNAYYGYSLNRATGKEIIKELVQDKDRFRFTYTPFFETICRSIETKGWVDIENEYYRLLEHYSLENYSAKDIKELNGQLHYLQELLTEYLTIINQQETPMIENIRKKIYAPINKFDISIESTKTLAEYIVWCNNQKKDIWDLKLYYYGINPITSGYIHDIEKFKSDSTSCTEYPKTYMLPEKIMLLNFNYTKTARKYLKQDRDIFSINHIHGVLENPDSIIFGYGDEFEDKYKKLQNLNNNECLTNIKTIRYQESDNYRKVLAFIESAPFQVYIMGHSCGNSDRTLLNTIFEHKNCISIKPYFYQKKDGTDSYIDLVQNISRNFTDMKLMRDRVVNRTYCETLTD